MGTSGIVHIHEQGLDTPTICHIYKQSDGYPDGLGDEIRDCLGPKNVVNGIRFDLENQANGSGCAAAQLIASLKDDVGGIYMLRTAPDWSDYDYHVFLPERPTSGGQPPTHFLMRVMSRKDVLWEGKLSEFDGASLYKTEDD